MDLHLRKLELADLDKGKLSLARPHENRSRVSSDRRCTGCAGIVSILGQLTSIGHQDRRKQEGAMTPLVSFSLVDQ